MYKICWIENGVWFHDIVCGSKAMSQFYVALLVKGARCIKVTEGDRIVAASAR